MSDFVTRLAQRQLGQLITVEPKLPSRFAASAPIVPMPVIEDVPTEASDSLRSTNLPPPQDPVPSGGAVPRNEGSAAGAVEPTIGHVPRQPRSASQNARRGAATDEPVAGRQNLEPQRAENRPAIERRIAGPETTGSFALSLVPQAISVGTPRGEPAKPPQQNYAEHGAAPAPLVLNQATVAVSASPRLESKASPRGASAVRSEVDAEPPIQVSIGRIEVTALTQAPPAKRTTVPRKPAMSLDDYLARRRRRES
jgi:hypothetical protein